MTDFLLVAVNRERSPTPVPPMGALLVEAACRQAGLSTAFLDLCFERRPRERLTRVLAAARPAVVGFSMRNLDTCMAARPRPAVGEVAALVQAVRRALPDARVILGGAGFSMSPAAVLAATGADAGVAGEGEEAAPRLVEFFLGRPGRSGDHEIPGVVWPDRESGLSPSRPAFTPPEPDFSLIPTRKYASAGGLPGAQTKRGCALACAYCSYPVLEGRSYRLRAPEEAAAALLHAAAAGGGQAYVTDSAFNAPAGHAKAVCEALIRLQARPKRRGRPAAFEAFVNPIGLDAELSALMRRAGFRGVELGLDSCAQPVLARLGKGFDLDQAARAAEALRRHGPPFAAYLLFGCPGETQDTARATAAFVDRFVRPRAVFAMTGVRVLPRTPLAAWLADEGVLPEGDPLLEPLFYHAPGLGSDPAGFVANLAAGRRNWLTPESWDSPLGRAASWLLPRLGVRPAWTFFQS